MHFVFIVHVMCYETEPLLCLYITCLCVNVDFMIKVNSHMIKLVLNGVYGCSTASIL